MLTSSSAAGDRRVRRDQGSSLLLVPAGVLIVFLLGAMAIDLSATHLAQRELLDAAASAANDGAGGGIDLAELRSSGMVRIDPERTRLVVLQSLMAQGIPGLLAEQTRVEVEVGRATVTVHTARRVDRLLAPTLPGSSRSVIVHATASARARTR